MPLESPSARSSLFASANHWPNWTMIRSWRIWPTYIMTMDTTFCLRNPGAVPVTYTLSWCSVWRGTLKTDPASGRFTAFWAVLGNKIIKRKRKKSAHFNTDVIKPTTLILGRYISLKEEVVLCIFWFILLIGLNDNFKPLELEKWMAAISSHGVHEVLHWV